MFARLAQITVILTLFLIVVGASVRVSGAGLGCPDWPKCWGCYWPPGDVSEAEARDHVEELIATGELVGPYDAEEHAWNEGLMWIEYGNRLVGVLLGLVIAALALVSLGQIRRRPLLCLASWAALLLVGFQGWLGAVVVKSGLEGQWISVHLFGALVLLALVTWIAQSERASGEAEGRGGTDWSMPWRSRQALGGKIGLLVGLSWVQIGLGSWVRDRIGPVDDLDVIQRGAALAEVGVFDHIHRAASWLVLGAAIYIFVRLRGHLIRRHPAKWWATTCLALVCIQMGFGVMLVYAGLPPIAQVGHVAFAALLVSAELWLLFGVLASRDPSGYDPLRGHG